jgi:hypothetical protein
MAEDWLHSNPFRALYGDGAPATFADDEEDDDVIRAGLTPPSLRSRTALPPAGKSAYGSASGLSADNVPAQGKPGSMLFRPKLYPARPQMPPPGAPSPSVAAPKSPPVAAAATQQPESNQPALGQLDQSIATSDKGQGTVNPSGPVMEEEPDEQPPTVAEQLAAETRPAPPKNNIWQRLGLAALSMTRLAPVANSLIHPQYAEQLRNYEAERTDLENKLANERVEAQIQAEKQHGQYWEDRGNQERNHFKLDPRTGAVIDMQTGEITQPPKTLQEKIQELKNVGFTDEQSRLIATGQKLSQMMPLPDALADNLQLPHGTELPTEHIDALISAANRPAPNPTEASLALTANDPTVSEPERAAARAALALLTKNRQAIRLTVNAAGANTGDRQSKADAWVNLIREGKAHLADVPKELKTDTAERMRDTPAPLSNTAQTALAQTEPVVEQVKRLIDELEPLKNNDTPGYFLPDRIGYAVGKSGSLGGLLADLSMAGVQGATRILKGGSRSQLALSRALEHTPSAWKDSPKNAYEKLQRMYKNLTDGIAAIRQEGNKYGIEGAIPQKAPEQPAAVVPSTPGSSETVEHWEKGADGKYHLVR